MSAEGHIPGSFRGVYPYVRLEPLPVRVDEDDNSHGRATDDRGERGDIVEFRFGGGVQYLKARQSFESLVFIRGDRCNCHTNIVGQIKLSSRPPGTGAELE